MNKSTGTFNFRVWCWLWRLSFLSACLIPLESAHAESGVAMYLANEGVLISHGETKIAFDPIFRDGFGQYLLLPEQMEAALFAGTAPFDGLDAIFISHYHGDHFSPADIVRLMETHTALLLFAPAQAVTAMRSEDDIEAIMNRIHVVSLAFQEAPVELGTDAITVEAVRIPHSGWPSARLDVENIAWRVTLDGATTVLHLGDADPRDSHFANDAEFWQRKQAQTAFPPYWFLGSQTGRDILEQRIGANRSIGIHVPIQIPADPLQRPDGLRGADLFTNPGETRQIRH